VSKGDERQIVTPEGVPLTFQIAPAGTRAASFLLDSFLQFLVALALALLLRFARQDGGNWEMAAGALLFFVLRSFYFVWFEIRWQGSTPGKRVNKIRVMDRRGGPLTADAVFVRNLMRELEIWLPLPMLFYPETIWPDAPGWARLVALVWVLLLALMPLFNRDRLRVGDLVAGTLVVQAPTARLLPDLSGEPDTRPAAAGADPVFTDAQLDVYGIYALQVLEDLLRKEATPRRREALGVVAARIRKKLDWTGPARGGDERFLRAFYVALRARLERKMLFGKRKADKHEA